MSIKSQFPDNEIIEVPLDLFLWYQHIVKEKLTALQNQVMEFAEEDMSKSYILLLPFGYFYEPETFKVEGWWGDEDFLKKNIGNLRILTAKE